MLKIFIVIVTWNNTGRTRRITYAAQSAKQARTLAGRDGYDVVAVEDSDGRRTA